MATVKKRTLRQAQGSGVKKAKGNSVGIEAAKGRKVKTFQTLRGFKDCLSGEQMFWQAVFTEAQMLARQYGYQFIETPIVENAALFKRSVGEYTDIVSKEMFTFKDASGESVVLRPEGTASIARAYLQHGMFTEPQPVRLWYWGPMFRYERPQAGRFREHHQFGFESIGDAHSIIDAQHILMCYNFFKNFGLTPLIHINSIGNRESRKEFVKKLTHYFRTHQRHLCDDCKKRLQKNPLRLLDCKHEQCQEIKSQAPQIVDHLADDDRDHFIKVLEYLDESDVPYQLNPYLVRGLDYYTRTVYEFLPNQEGAGQKSQNSLGGGGRYDDLIYDLGGRPTPAAGFALGIERVLLAIRDAGYTPPPPDNAQIFIAQLGEQARHEALRLFEELRARGIVAHEALSKDSLKPQLERAAAKNVKYTFIIGQKEVLDGTVIIRDMESGIQEIVDRKKVIVELVKKLNPEKKEE